MQFVTSGNRIAVENFTVGYLYTITFTGGEYIHCACTGIGMDFVMFSRTAPEYTFALTMETAEDVSSIDLYSEGGGTMNYNDLTNKPQINGVELTGNKSSSDIGIQPLITADNKLSYTMVSGLGTAATTASSDYATAAQGALADSAVQPADMNSALNAKQNLINSDNMLSADLVDDTSTTNKFATAAELQQIETNKTNILSNTADDYLNWTKAKNKLNYDINTAKALNTSSIYTWSGNTCTVNGITYTFNSDKTITATGSIVDSTTNAILSLAEYTGATGDILSAQQTGNAYIYLRGGSTSTASTLYHPWSNGDVGVARTVAVVITSTETATINKTFYPMVCTTADWQKSQGYFPYALSNVDLTTLSKQNQTNISSITPTVYITGDVTSITISGITENTNPSCLLMCVDRRTTSAEDSVYLVTRYGTTARISTIVGTATPTVSMSGDTITLSGIRNYQQITALAAKAITIE